jgi:hypothetical protein
LPRPGAPDHEPPGDNCTCGIYAARGLDQIPPDLEYAGLGWWSVRSRWQARSSRATGATAQRARGS